tara:strand:+ start:537 stop:773 length:237 start_codon:yes stop_codon:yes gene_type:complete
MINAFWTIVVWGFCIGMLIYIISSHQNSREDSKHFKNFVLNSSLNSLKEYKRSSAYDNGSINQRKAIEERIKQLENEL